MIQEKVRQSLGLGVSEDQVFCDGRNQLTPSKTLRSHNVITKKYVQNVANRFELGASGQYHTEDPISIDLFVQEQEEKKEVKIISYKKQGNSDDDYPGVKSKDFILAFLTLFQQKMIEEMNSWDSAIICMDATHDTNAYNFFFITI